MSNRRGMLAGIGVGLTGFIANLYGAKAQQIVQTNDGPIVSSGGDIVIEQSAAQTADGSYNEGSYNVTEESQCCPQQELPFFCSGGVAPWVVFITEEGGLAYYDDQCNVCRFEIKCKGGCR